MEKEGETTSDSVTLESSVFKSWIENQIEIAPTLHRSFYRRRANPRIFQGLILPTGSNRGPCDKGSRWQRYAIDDSDKGKTVVATRTADGSVNIVVDGDLRTVVPEAEFLLDLIEVSHL